MEVITLYAQGWSKRSISRFLHVSRPTIPAWIARFEAENLDSLEDRSRAPKTTVRKAWLPAMVEIYHLQKRHPDAGGFRIWSLRGKRDLWCGPSSASWRSTDRSLTRIIHQPEN